MSHTLDWARKHSLAAYFVLANALTWLCMLPTLLNVPDQPRRFPAISSLAAYGPLVTALLVTWVSEGIAGLRDLWHRTIRWRVGARWYLTVFTLPLAMNIVALSIGLLAGSSPQDMVSSTSQLHGLLRLLPGELLTSGLEEPGWRGYALPKLQERHTALKSSWILGVLWAVWHVPAKMPLTRQ